MSTTTEVEPMTQLMTEQGMVRVPAGTWTVDPVHSSVAFEVKHMMILDGARAVP
jgi:polyisoprenoid-binding protein YceI